MNFATPKLTGSGNQQQGGQQGQSDFSNQQQGQFPIGPKDKSENGSAFVFADPDKIKEAIEALAHETELNEFVDLLGIAGLGGLSCKDREKLWFTAQSSDIIPIEEKTNIRTAIKKNIDSWKDSPGFFGYYIADEPGTSLISSLREVTLTIREYDQDHVTVLHKSQKLHSAVTDPFCIVSYRIQH